MSTCTDAVGSASAGNILLGKKSCNGGSTTGSCVGICGSSAYTANVDFDAIDLEKGSDLASHFGDVYESEADNSTDEVKILISLEDAIRTGHNRFEQRLDVIERSVRGIEKSSGGRGHQYYCNII